MVPIRNELSKLLGDRVLFSEPLARHTSLHIGGPADAFALVKDEEELSMVIGLCRKEGVPFYLLGNGSNLLVGDEGFRGVVASPCRYMATIQVEGEEIYAQAGAALMKVAAVARDASLEGLAFAGGIPGSVGGAVMMNAGAYGGEICQVLLEALVMDQEGQKRWAKAEELDLSYRHSRLMETGEIVLAARFGLKIGNGEEIGQRMKELLAQRAQKQPLEYPSAGSTFKRPEGYFAGKLIQEAGLRGCRQGGMMVSEKHCGFLVNVDNATAQDMICLMRHVREKVKEESGVLLEPEVRYLAQEGEGWGDLLG